MGFTTAGAAAWERTTFVLIAYLCRILSAGAPSNAFAYREERDLSSSFLIRPK